MSRLLKSAVFLLAVLLSGALGFSSALSSLPPVSTAAVQVDVDLTEKTRETEPEERPSATDIEVEIVRREHTPGTPLRVLIYHTHTYEAYEPDFEGQYTPTERWRTADSDYNVVHVGAEIARILREEYGMVVVHDDTAFEPPWLDTAYQRSLEALENYTARGETFDLYLDVHRDAYVQGSFAENTVDAGGAPAARLMLLVGDGSGTFGGQAFAQKPTGKRTSRAPNASPTPSTPWRRGCARPYPSRREDTISTSPRARCSRRWATTSIRSGRP